MLEIPHSKLSLDALKGVISEFILREGTDYGDKNWTLEEKIKQVLMQVQNGSAVIVYDEGTESLNILTKN